MDSVIVLDQCLVKSEAWLSLSGAAIIVYLIFRTKCRIDKLQGKPGKRRRVIVNNGEIVFTYVEALKKYGITTPRFKRAIDELLAKGFIDIAATGMGVHKVTTYYAISDRWREYGMPEFKGARRPKRSRNYPGFKRGNKFWQKAHKKKSTDENVHGAVYENVHGAILAMYTNVHGEKVTTLYKRSNDKWLASKVA